MADLKIDLDAVTSLGSSLTKVAGEFDGANAHSDRIAGAVGHGHLADTVRDFAHKWDDTRGKMTDNLKALADAATNVAQAFTDTDGELAKALTDDGSSTPAPSPTHAPVPAQ
ncbi:hypothetical protein [Luteimicrobium subarcticum]|uniref:Excreted virulence factor EspC (Type VII ESX diderm) n=1 Tax=Luteimicrobium subarcticum TaxID=620910 RepID=A0A2M8WJ11_9MICO|nr:hypothetical protein [Luteimicrobium subarcticum]PJI90921.1 hypothetical protein CLV34_2177 [Luteimicrobium subarcticum]